MRADFIKLLLVLIDAVLTGVGGCAGSNLQRYEYKRLCMGVEARVVVYAEGEERAVEGARAAYARIAALEQIFSDYRAGSEVMRLCAQPAGQWTCVSEDLFRVLAVSDAVNGASGGAFDPSVGPLTVLWRGARDTGVLSDGAAVEAARARTGWTKVRLDTAERSVRLDVDGMRLDFGGIAKGYAAAAAVETLRGMGMPRVMVALAGDVAVGDAPAGKRGWSVEIDPGVEGVEPFAVEVSNVSVSTSGDREQFVEVGGVRYSHILDPRTGVGLTRRVAACAVSRDGAVADAVATGACVMEPGADALAALLRARVVKESGTKVWVWRE